ncbi:hypothetical protein B0H14DRAFT_3726185 [Mycena olivaceomarginata]|nr:hypothetical protein B0H14DRAFT_3726185 [Mycena olivaceomarginata]
MAQAGAEPKPAKADVELKQAVGSNTFRLKEKSFWHSFQAFLKDSEVGLNRLIFGSALRLSQSRAELRQHYLKPHGHSGSDARAQNPYARRPHEQVLGWGQGEGGGAVVPFRVFSYTSPRSHISPASTARDGGVDAANSATYPHPRARMSVPRPPHGTTLSAPLSAEPAEPLTPPSVAPAATHAPAPAPRGAGKESEENIKIRRYAHIAIYMGEKRLLGYSKAKLVPEIGELLASIAGADVSQGRPLEVYPAQGPPGPADDVPGRDIPREGRRQPGSPSVRSRAAACNISTSRSSSLFRFSQTILSEGTRQPGASMLEHEARPFHRRRRQERRALGHDAGEVPQRCIRIQLEEEAVKVTIKPAENRGSGSELFCQ